VILSLLLQLKMLLTLPEKQGSSNSWQLPTELSLNSLFAWNALGNVGGAKGILNLRERKKSQVESNSPSGGRRHLRSTGYVQHCRA
jgi:hypothetical protein